MSVIRITETLVILYIAYITLAVSAWSNCTWSVSALSNMHLVLYVLGQSLFILIFAKLISAWSTLLCSWVVGWSDFQERKIGHSASCAKTLKDPKSKSFLLNVAYYLPQGLRKC